MAVARAGFRHRGRFELFFDIDLAIRRHYLDVMQQLALHLNKASPGVFYLSRMPSALPLPRAPILPAPIWVHVAPTPLWQVFEAGAKRFNDFVSAPPPKAFLDR